MSVDAWPELRYAEWAPTKKTLQMCAQMLGKLRLALAPLRPGVSASSSTRSRMPSWAWPKRSGLTRCS